jgi:hypothetical protein
MLRAAFRALMISSTLALLASRALAVDGPGDRPGGENRARGERKSEAVKGERRTDDPDDADSGLQKKSKAGEKRAEPAP